MYFMSHWPQHTNKHLSPCISPIFRQAQLQHGLCVLMFIKSWFQNYIICIVKYSGGSESASWVNQFTKQPVNNNQPATESSESVQPCILTQILPAMQHKLSPLVKLLIHFGRKLRHASWKAFSSFTKRGQVLCRGFAMWWTFKRGLSLAYYNMSSSTEPLPGIRVLAWEGVMVEGFRAEFNLGSTLSQD